VGSEVSLLLQHRLLSLPPVEQPKVPTHTFGKGKKNNYILIVE
jgi:hypothetical protein